VHSKAQCQQHQAATLLIAGPKAELNCFIKKEFCVAAKVGKSGLASSCLRGRKVTKLLRYGKDFWSSYAGTSLRAACQPECWQATACVLSCQ
jgi:hypothetical protein